MLPCRHLVNQLLAIANNLSSDHVTAFRQECHTRPYIGAFEPMRGEGGTGREQLSPGKGIKWLTLHFANGHRPRHNARENQST